MSYRAVNPRFAVKHDNIAAVKPAELRRLVDDAWTAYQDSRFGYMIMRLNQALPIAYVTAEQAPGRAAEDATSCLCLRRQIMPTDTQDSLGERLGS